MFETLANCHFGNVHMARAARIFFHNHVAAAFPVGYDSRLGFSFRVLVKVRVRLGLG